VFKFFIRVYVLPIIRFAGEHFTLHRNVEAVSIVDKVFTFNQRPQKLKKVRLYFCYCDWWRSADE